MSSCGSEGTRRGHGPPTFIYIYDNLLRKMYLAPKDNHKLSIFLNFLNLIFNFLNHMFIMKIKIKYSILFYSEIGDKYCYYVLH